MRGMARRRTRRRVVALAALAIGTAVLGACSGSDDGAAFTPVAGSDSAYCATYRAWKVYELDNGGAFDQPTPAALLPSSLGMSIRKEPLAEWTE